MVVTNKKNMKFLKNNRLLIFLGCVLVTLVSCDETLDTDITLPEEIKLEIRATDNANFNILREFDNEGILKNDAAVIVPKSFKPRNDKEIVYTLSENSQPQGRNRTRLLNNRSASIVVLNENDPKRNDPQFIDLDDIIGELNIAELNPNTTDYRWTVVGIVSNINGQRLNGLEQEAIFSNVLDHFDVLDKEGNVLSVNTRPATTIELGLYGTTLAIDSNGDGRINGRDDPIFNDRVVHDFGFGQNEIIIRAKQLSLTDDDVTFRFIIQLEADFPSGRIDRRTIEIAIIRPGTTFS